jgi:hypothetical protein
LALAVLADVAKKEVAESDGADAFRYGAAANARHQIFVHAVRARPWKFYGPQGKADAPGLFLNQSPPDRVHGNAIGRAVEGCDQRCDLNAGCLPQKVQRPGAVLAAAPRQGDAFHAGRTPEAGRSRAANNDSIENCFGKTGQWR